MKSINYLLLLPCFFFLFISCNEDDEEDDIAVVCTTFLECQDGTVWKYVEMRDNEPFNTYFKLRDNLQNPMEVYNHLFQNDCYLFMDMTQADGVFKIIENSKLKLTVRITGDENDMTEWDLLIVNNRLELDIRNYEDDIMYESFQIFLDRSYDDVNQLNLCDNM